MSRSVGARFITPRPPIFTPPLQGAVDLAFKAKAPVELALKPGGVTLL